MARWITDAGSKVIMTDTQTGEETDIGQYGVWDTHEDGYRRRKPEVIACGNDLEVLQAKYGPDLEVATFDQLRGSNEESTAS